MNTNKLLLLTLLILSFSVDGKSTTARANLNVSESVEIKSHPSSSRTIDLTMNKVIVRRNKMISIIENNKTRTLSSGSTGEIISDSKETIELFL